MMLCATKTIRFARCKGRQIQVNFNRLLKVGKSLLMPGQFF